MPYRIRRSERARRARIVVDGGGVEVVVPRGFAACQGRAVRGGEAPLDRAHAAAPARVRGRAAAGAARGRRRRALPRRAPAAAAGSSAGAPAERRDPAAASRSRAPISARRRCATRSSAGTGAARARRCPRDSTPPWRARARRYRSLQIRGQRSRWASCSSSGGMSFNWRLLLAPRGDPRLRGRARGGPPRRAGPLAALLDPAGRARARTGASTNAGCGATGTRCGSSAARGGGGG